MVTRAVHRGNFGIMDGFISNAIVAGIFATVILDLWQRVLYAATGIPATNWGIVGRWFGHMPRGRFVHEAIGEAEPVANEAIIGWTMHYLIGIIYGVVYVGLMVFVFSSTPSLLNGFLFGLASVVIPWFVMQPALGVGIMGSKAPNPAVPRYTALAAHCLYGVALYGGSALHRALAA
jgi:hypothetical protein